MVYVDISSGGVKKAEKENDFKSPLSLRQMYKLELKTELRTEYMMHIYSFFNPFFCEGV